MYRCKILILWILAVLASCGSGEPKEENPDTPILINDSIVITDTSTYSYFGKRFPEFDTLTGRLREFYQNRDHAFVWFTEDGPKPYLHFFLSLLHETMVDTATTLRRWKTINDMVRKVWSDEDAGDQPVTATVLEMYVTAAFFDFAESNWSGSEKELRAKSGWFISQQRTDYAHFLDSVINSGTEEPFGEPVYRQYGLLKKFLGLYRKIEERGGWPQWKDVERLPAKGSEGPLVTRLIAHLRMTGDLEKGRNSDTFDDEVADALKNFQRRHGIEDDTADGKKTLAALAVPVHDRITQILVNMERCRWLPVSGKGKILVVNIPDYKLHVYDGDSLLWSSNVIVGKATTGTVIFNDYLEYIAFNPYWSVPRSILTGEMLPQIIEDPGYIAKHNLEVVDADGEVIDPDDVNWKKYDGKKDRYTVRQKPGPSNSLGRLKFLFPNSHSIYLHDTPQKSLFSQSTRAFSHGCIRLSEPVRLAEFLLENDDHPAADQIEELIDAGKEKTVRLKHKIPVYIVYFTSWVDRQGFIHFRDDIYHHDGKMKQLIL